MTFFFFTKSKHMVVPYHLYLLFFFLFLFLFSKQFSVHHQLVFHFIFKRNRVKSKFDFFKVDLKLKKIKEYISNNSRKINKEKILPFKLLLQP